MVVDYKSSFGDLPAMFREYAEIKDVAIEDVMEDRAAKLVSSDFGNGVIGLFQAGAEIAPKAEELFALPQKLNWRIKRKGRPVFTRYETKVGKRGKNKGRSREVRVGRIGEIERRMKSRLYHASGWLNANFLKYGRTQMRKGVQSQVSLRFSGNVLEVVVVNSTTQAQEVVSVHGDYIQRVLDLQVADMLEYIQRKLEQQNATFNQRKLALK